MPGIYLLKLIVPGKVKKLFLHMSKKTLILIISAILILPNLAFAQVTIQSMVVAVVNTAWIIATGVVVVLWIITGILFLSAQGAPEKISIAKKALISAVVGTVLVVLAYTALSLVRSAIGI